MRTERFEFPNAKGEKLAAQLDLPLGEPTAFALFAHCFTCGKDILAAKRIAERLSVHGIATLRFDFTGLGASEGEFANTHFSSNVDDLVAAADHLRKMYQAPAILIGHSLGGAAVLAAVAPHRGSARGGDHRRALRPQPRHRPVQGACRQDPRTGRSRGAIGRAAVPHQARIPQGRRRAAAEGMPRQLAQGAAGVPFAHRRPGRHRQRLAHFRRRQAPEELRLARRRRSSAEQEERRRSTSPT